MGIGGHEDTYSCYGTPEKKGPPCKNRIKLKKIKTDYQKLTKPPACPLDLSTQTPILPKTFFVCDGTGTDRPAKSASKKSYETAVRNFGSGGVSLHLSEAKQTL